MNISVKGTKLKIFKDLEIQQTVERDNVGQYVTLQARIPYDSLMCFEFPKSCGGLPLVGDADGGDLLGVDVGAVHRLRQGPLLRGPDLHGVMLHPAGLGIDLVEGILGPGDDISRPVEQDGTGAGGALVQGDHIGFHRTRAFLVFLRHTCFTSDSGAHEIFPR